MKSLFEQNGETYTKVGDYYIPNLTVPECKRQIWYVEQNISKKSPQSIL